MNPDDDKMWLKQISAVSVFVSLLLNSLPLPCPPGLAVSLFATIAEALPQKQMLWRSMSGFRMLSHIQCQGFSFMKTLQIFFHKRKSSRGDKCFRPLPNCQSPNDRVSRSQKLFTPLPKVNAREVT